MQFRNKKSVNDNEWDLKNCSLSNISSEHEKSDDEAYRATSEPFWQQTSYVYRVKVFSNIIVEIPWG